MLNVVVQSPSRVHLFATPWTAAHQASLSLIISQNLPKFMSIASVMPSSHLNLWLPLVILSSIFPSIRDFSSELAAWIRWPNYWSFSFSISPSNEYSGLIFLKIDWFDHLAVQGTFRILLQNHSSKVSILWHSAFFTVQFSKLYMTTGKTVALTIRTLCWQSNVSVFQHTVYVCHCFPTKKQQSSDFTAAAVIHSDLGIQENEAYHYFHLFPFYLWGSNGIMPIRNSKMLFVLFLFG